jgi:hypothetical protein
VTGVAAVICTDQGIVALEVTGRIKSDFPFTESASVKWDQKSNNLALVSGHNGRSPWLRDQPCGGLDREV